MAEALFAALRNGVVERLERGHAVLADASGTVVWSAGDPDHITYLRSSAKPLQAVAVIVSGAVDRYGLSDTELAVACGSHLGEERHVSTVLSLLRHADVPPTALACGTHDLRPAQAERLARAGLGPTPLHNNCSGKHAGMLAAARALGAPLDGYLDLAHPVQEIIRDVVARCADLPSSALHIGIDGCSAPNFALPMHAIARCFARLAAPETLGGPYGPALTRIGAAMRADPWLVRGTGGFDTALMSSLRPRVTSKAGAEALQCVALPELGLGLAVKFESGREDGLGAVVLRILRALGVAPAETPPDLAPYDAPPLRNHRGIVVGAARVLLEPSALPAPGEARR